jgi:hypothetical protein
MRRIEKSGAEVIDLLALREKRLREKTQEEYSSYLTGLGISQLEGEAHHLLEEFSGQNFGADYTQRVQLLLGELAGRADEPFRGAIQRLGPQMNPDL